jgi:sarcosine oxidase, subunit gamma
MADRPRRDAAARPWVTLAEHPFLAQVDLRGDPGDAMFVRAAGAGLGVPLPLAPNRAATGDTAAVLWLGPDEWLIVTETEPGDALAARLRHALEGLNVAVTDVSDARTVIRLAGPAARDVLAKGASLDLHPDVFPPGACAQTSLARVAVILHQTDRTPIFDVFVARSFAEHLWAWLADAAVEFAP